MSRKKNKSPFTKTTKIVSVKTNSDAKQERINLPKKIEAKKSKRIGLIRILNQSPVSNRLQKINLIATTILAIISALLAILTFNQAIKIEGMQQILESYKPYVSIKVSYFMIKSDSLFFSGTLKNYGQRGASNIQVEYYTILDSNIHLEPENTSLYLSPYEEFKYTDSFSCKKYFNPLDSFANFTRFQNIYVAFKIKYTDNVLNDIDSTYEIWTKQKFKGNLLIFEPSTDTVITFVKSVIRNHVNKDF